MIHLKSVLVSAGLFLVALTTLTVQGKAQSDTPGLALANSAELQRLLHLQERQLAALYKRRTPPHVPADVFDRLFMWNEIALDITAIDHTPVRPGESRTFGKQYGATRASPAMAIVHIAICEAINAVTQQYQSYTGLAPSYGAVSVNYAIAQAAHDCLISLYPSQTVRLDTILRGDIEYLRGGNAKLVQGQTLGTAAAQSILAQRNEDGAQVPDPQAGGTFTLLGGVGHWTPDPVSGLTLYLGAYWGQVKPFTLQTGDQFRAPPPPTLTSLIYTHAFE